MVESGLITALASIFILGGIYIPFLGYGLMLVPVPFIIIGTKHGFKYSILSVIATSLIIGSLTEPVTALFVFLMGGIGPIVMAYMIKKRYSYGKIVTVSSIAFIISIAISLSIMSYFLGASLADMIEETFTLSTELNENIFKSIGVDSTELDESLKMIDQAKTLAITLIPASIVFGGFFISFINYTAARSILKRMKIDIESPIKFTHFRLPKNIVMGTLVILVLTHIVGVTNIANYDILLTNVLYIFTIMYLIQGLAVANFYMENRGIGKVVRIIISVIVITMSSLSLGLVLLGLLDVIFNLRKI